MHQFNRNEFSSIETKVMHVHIANEHF